MRLGDSDFAEFVVQFGSIFAGLGFIIGYVILGMNVILSLNGYFEFDIPPRERL